MSHARSVFSQLIAYLPQRQLDTIIERYQGNWHVRRFPVWSQLLCMTYAQLTHRDSLRDVEACLNSQGKRLYHMGIQHRVARSTLADANEVRDFRIFQEFGQLLITQALELYHDEPLGFPQSNRRNKIGVKSNGVTALDGADAGPGLTELLAVTVQV